MGCGYMARFLVSSRFSSMKVSIIDWLNTGFRKLWSLSISSNASCGILLANYAPGINLAS